MKVVKLLSVVAILYLASAVSSSVQAVQDAPSKESASKEAAKTETTSENPNVQTRAKFLEFLTAEQIYRGVYQRKRFIVYISRNKP